MSDRDLVLRFLNESTKFRERKHKNAGLVYLLKRKFPALNAVDSKILEEAVKDYSGMDRWWRRHLEENKSLRGSDYGEGGGKEILEQEKQIELGYEVGIDNDLSKLKEL